MRPLQLLATTVLSALAVAALAMPVPAAAPVQPVYVAGGQYRAALNQSTRYWTLMPPDGQDLVVGNPDLYCRADAPLPQGIWLVARDAEGAVELRAPSHTALPPGYPERVALKSCADRSPGTALHAPQALIDWLAANTGAVYVHD